MVLKGFRWLRTPGLLLVLLCMVVPSLAGADARPPLSVQPQENREIPAVMLHLAAGSFDPLVESRPSFYPADLMSGDDVEDGPEYYVVQFDGPITEARKADLIGQGARLFDYIPDYAFVVQMDARTRARVEQLDGVRRVGLYQPAYRISPTLLAQDQDLTGMREFNVLTFPGEHMQIADRVHELGGEVLEQSESTRTGRLRVRLDAVQIQALAAASGVRWIESAPEYQIYNNAATDLMNAREVWNTHGLYGTGQTVAVADTGLDQGSTSPVSLHDDFEDGSGNSRVVALFDLGGNGDGASDVNSGHGTHVAGSVLGNGDLSGATPSTRTFPNSAYAGLAPEANLVFQAVENNVTEELDGIPFDLTPLFSQAEGAGASIHTNSWGSDVDGAYTSDSETVDAYIWDHPGFTILFAAGNAGTDAGSDGVVGLGSVGSPATAKNAITVGASENNRPAMPGTYGGAWPSDYPVNPIYGDALADDPQGMAAFSSRGPTLDRRYKPDIVAPGTYIASVRSSQASSTGWGEINTAYMYMGGTSMATPLAAGAAALVRQFYTDREGIVPSAALIKATLINGATSLSPGQYGTGGTQEIPDPPRPNNVEGWGRVNVENSIFPESPRSLHYTDHITGLLTGEVATFMYQVAASAEPLRVTLVWSDYAGSPAANGGLVNDLDLTVTGPSAAIFYPTGALQRPGDQLLNPQADNKNNVEGVDILNPSGGTYTIQVRGNNVPQGPQPFALVVSGEIGDEYLEVSGIQPEYAYNNGVFSDGVVSGGGFSGGAQVHLVNGGGVIPGTAPTIDTAAGTITADFDLNGAMPGWWDVRVTNSPGFSAAQEDAFYVIDATLPNLSIAITTEKQSVEPGSWLTYTISIQNQGFVSATQVVFTDTLPHGMTYESLSPGCVGGTVTLPDGDSFSCLAVSGALNAGGKVEFTLVVSVSHEASGSVLNQVSVGSDEPDGYSFDNSGEASVTLAGRAIYLPILERNWSLAPAPPILDSISNSDQNGDYTVSWSASSGATNYTLQEAANASFTNATTAYSGSGLSATISGKGTGTYYYRVMASNAKGDSAWSNTESVVVNGISGGIANGDFENGPDGSWTESSTNGWDLIVQTLDDPATPHSGSWAVWLGGDYDEVSQIEQSVTIPSGSPALEFWYWIGSEDFCGFDFGSVVINGSTVVDAFDLCEDENTGGWVKRTVSMSAFAGQTVSIRIGAETDGSLNSNFFIDDVALSTSGLALDGPGDAARPAADMSDPDSARPRP